MGFSVLGVHFLRSTVRLDAVPSPVLGPEHSHVGSLDQVGGRVFAAELGNADAHGDRHSFIAVDERLCGDDLLAETFGRKNCLVTWRVWQDD